MSADANDSQEGSRLAKIREALGLSVDDETEQDDSQEQDDKANQADTRQNSVDDGFAENILEETDEGVAPEDSKTAEEDDIVDLEGTSTSTPDLRDPLEEGSSQDKESDKPQDERIQAIREALDRYALTVTEDEDQLDKEEVEEVLSRDEGAQEGAREESTASSKLEDLDELKTGDINAITEEEQETKQTDEGKHSQSEHAGVRDDDVGSVSEREEKALDDTVNKPSRDLVKPESAENGVMNSDVEGDVVTQSVEKPDAAHEDEDVDESTQDNIIGNLDELENNVSALEEDMDAALNKLDVVQLRSVERRARSLLDALDKAIPSYRDTVENLEATLNDVRDEIKEAKQELEDTDEAIKSKEQELRSTRERRREEERKLTQVERERNRFEDTFERERNTKEKELEDLDERIERKRKKMQDLEEHIQAKEEAHKKKLTDLQTDIDEARAEYEEILDETNGVIQDLEEKEESLVDSKKELQKQVSEHKRILEALRAEDKDEGEDEEPERSEEEIEEVKEQLFKEIGDCEDKLKAGKINEALTEYNRLRDTYQDRVESQEALDEVYTRLMQTYQLLSDKLHVDLDDDQTD